MHIGWGGVRGDYNFDVSPDMFLLCERGGVGGDGAENGADIVQNCKTYNRWVAYGQRKTADMVQNCKTYNRWVAYGQSKTGNMLMALSLAEKLGGRGLQAYSLHPGVVFMGLVGHVGVELGPFFEELRELTVSC
jgi:NAD(P)-dependent dehydrogenase (short-subunit alcohol dehydrogenase family)